MSNLKPCPIEGCKSRWHNRNGLEGHLWRNHRKSEIIKALLDGLTIHMCMVHGKVEIRCDPKEKLSKRQRKRLSKKWRDLIDEGKKNTKQ